MVGDKLSLSLSLSSVCVCEIYGKGRARREIVVAGKGHEAQLRNFKGLTYSELQPRFDHKLPGIRIGLILHCGERVDGCVLLRGKGL